MITMHVMQMAIMQIVGMTVMFESDMAAARCVRMGVMFVFRAGHGAPSYFLALGTFDRYQPLGDATGRVRTRQTRQQVKNLIGSLFLKSHLPRSPGARPSACLHESLARRFRPFVIRQSSD